MVRRNKDSWQAARRAGGSGKSPDSPYGRLPRRDARSRHGNRGGSSASESAGDARPAESPRWSDAAFRIALVVWLVLGLASILRTMLLDRSSLAQVLLVAWGVLVIFVLWFRLGPPRDNRHNREVLR